MDIRAHAFQPRDFVGGHVVLDLMNTVTARDADPIDWLDEYSRLLEWAALTGQFERSALRALRRESSSDPREAALALHRVRELREATREVLVTILGQAKGAERALGRVQSAWRDAAAHARFGLAGGRVELRLAVQTSGLEYFHHALALRSLELFGSLPLARTRICPGPSCGWVFVDRSKGGRRRWCDMATCGNVEKSRRYRQRH